MYYGTLDNFVTGFLDFALLKSGQICKTLHTVLLSGSAMAFQARGSDGIEGTEQQQLNYLGAALYDKWVQHHLKLTGSPTVIKQQEKSTSANLLSTG